jgi:hypothetical protein
MITMVSNEKKQINLFLFYDRICHLMPFVAPLHVFSPIIKMDGLKNHDLL